jgi:hypothetical protein
MLARTTSAADPAILSDSERAAGWKLLFDGKSLNGWRSYKAQDKPKPGWTVDEGILKKKKGRSRAAIS